MAPVSPDFRAISRCRLCDSLSLYPIISLDNLALAGVFPKSRLENVTKAPLELINCVRCGLVQLAHSVNPSLNYGQDYGYRSSLNASMVKHLHNLAEHSKSRVQWRPRDIVLDIGSNDATLLKQFPGWQRIGFDPSGHHRDYENIEFHQDFFSKKAFGNRKAKIITSIAMFYDLEKPAEFVQQVKESLTDDGIWIFEQSYLPSMLRNTSYDTICHEHLEYYSLGPISLMIAAAGMKILDVEFNDVNGGSICITAAKTNEAWRNDKVDAIVKAEREFLMEATFVEFAIRVKQHRQRLRDTLSNPKMKVFGYGASTKGNVMPQYCGIGPETLPYIAEVNPDKFGCFTPGTKIPIISEVDARKKNPDAYLVLPWHFRESIVKREKSADLIFPLPKLELVRQREKVLALLKNFFKKTIR